MRSADARRLCGGSRLWHLAGDAAPVATQHDTGTPGDNAVETALPRTVVEVVADDSSEPSPEITAAHADRRARRQAAREAKAFERRDFLSSLNLDLLTAEQRERHALYLEAVTTRDTLRKELGAVRSAGREAPPDLQARLSDAESVLRADREAELRALREAAARAAGLGDAAVRQLVEDCASIDGVMGLGDSPKGK